MEEMATKLKIVKICQYLFHIFYSTVFSKDMRKIKQ